MNKRIIAVVIILIVTIGVIGITVGLQSLFKPAAEPTPTPAFSPTPAENPNNLTDSENSFNVVFRYGVGAKNELNTINGTFTKDLVIDNNVTTTLILSKEDLDGLQQKIIEIGLFSYPDSFPVNPNHFVTPQSDYYIRVQSSSTVKEVSWNTNSQIENNIQENLNQLTTYIINIIEQKPEYKALPNPNGGYL